MERVRAATATDRPGAIRTLGRAFAADPVVRWFFPDDRTYPARAASFFGFLIDARLAGGAVFVTEEVSAVSAWNPPGGNRRGAAWVEERWFEAVAGFAGDEHARLDGFETATASMHPEEPHWYLGIVGVDPDAQGAGWGRGVIRPGLAAADRDGVEVYLETVEHNLAFYERLGFRTTATADLSGGPTLVGLRRAPRVS